MIFMKVSLKKNNIKNGENLNLNLNSGFYRLIIKNAVFSEYKMVQVIKEYYLLFNYLLSIVSTLGIYY